MKKLYGVLMFFVVFMFPMFAQDDMLLKEDVPVESLTFKKGNIPPAVMKTAEELFKGNPQVAWGVFPYEFKDYGWVVNKDYSEPIDHYEVQFKAADGSDIYAVFESTGELIRYRITNMKAALPPEILKSIAQSQYKDWKVVGKTEKVNESQRKIVEHYIVKLENGGKKKTLYFTSKGDLLTNK
jgi:hypothetical protein